MVNDLDKAEYWYHRCIKFDPERVDCYAFIARLYYDHDRTTRALEFILKTMTLDYPLRAFGNNFYIYQCFVPITAIKILAKVT